MTIGINFIIAAIFPMIPIVVKSHIIGSAYGLSSSLINIGLSLGPIIIGLLTQPNQNEIAYISVNIFLACFSGIGVILSVVLYFLDKYRLNSLLQKSSGLLQQISLEISTNILQLAATKDQLQD